MNPASSVRCGVEKQGAKPEHKPDRSEDAIASLHSADTLRPSDTPSSQIHTVLGSTGTDSFTGSLTSTHGLPSLDGYDVLRRVGQGGMGAVFEGVQQATGRRVAIKFLLNADLVSEAMRSRFEREVSIVARLDHPGIIRVIDSGVKRGRYFYVMDYVDGVSLDETFIRLRHNTSDALRLVIDICETVDYAHQRGVLHRDLKPSNIIVDLKGRPRLLDFGIAKSEDVSHEKGLTYASEGGTSTLGTLAYMSPEQAAGESHRASVRSDVYSLGVIAYECVTGRLPISVDGSLREALTRVVEHEPPPPSTLSRKVSADLDAVLLKALEKRPEQRYASASEFADELSRTINGEPVMARRITPVARMVKWTRRNKAVSATIAIAAATLVAVSSILVYRVLQERDEARKAAAESDLSARRALRASAEAKTQREHALASAQEASENFDILRSILRSANSDAGGEVTVRQMLDRAATGLDKNPPKSPATEAAIRETIGVVYRNLGLYDQAKALLKRAYEVRLEQSDDVSTDATLAACAHEYAATLWWRGEFAEAQPLYEMALNIRRTSHPGDHKDVAFSLTHLAANNLRLGKVDEAFGGYTQALEMRRRMYGAEHEEVAQSLNNLAKAYFEEERYDEAKNYFREALAMIRRLKGDEFAGTASVLQNLAQCLLDEGEITSAITTFSQALDIRTRLFPSGHHLVATSLVGLARSYLASGDLPRAEDCALRAIAIYRGISYEGKMEYAEAIAGLGSIRLAQNQIENAISTLTESSATLTRVRPLPVLPLAQVELDLGEALIMAGRSEDGKAQVQRGLERIIRDRGAGSRLARAARARIEALGAN